MTDFRLWVAFTFNSPKKTAELLRPEVDSGTLSYHDYEIAKEGLPGQHKLNRWFTAGILISCGMFAYGKFVRVPPIVRPSFYNMAAPLPAFTLGMVGFYREYQAKSRLYNELDDPAALAQAIMNVRDRLGGPRGIIEFANQRASNQTWGDGSSTQPETHAQQNSKHGDASSPRDRQTDDRPNADTPAGNRNQSRWGQIRNENGQSSQRLTSWDKIRKEQSNARSTPSEPRKPQDGAFSQTETDAEQATEQDKFNAMIDSERRSATERR